MEHTFESFYNEVKQNIHLKNKQKEMENKLVSQHIEKLTRQDVISGFEEATEQLCSGFHLCSLPDKTYKFLHLFNLRQKLEILTPDLLSNSNGCFVCPHGMICITQPGSRQVTYTIPGEEGCFVDYCADVGITYRPRITHRQVS